MSVVEAESSAPLSTPDAALMAVGNDGVSTADMASQLRRANGLLLDLYPRQVAEALRDGRRLSPQRSEEATVVFMDIVHFTDICSELAPAKVCNMLHRLFCNFDCLSMQFGVYKVETIGDAYVGVTNLVAEQRADHALRAARFALATVRAAVETLVDIEDTRKGNINIRVGFDCGPVEGNVVGIRNLRFSLFGDTVNCAARMEAASAPGHILCTERAMKLVSKQAPEIPLFFRGEVPVKGKGSMRTYWVQHMAPAPPDA